MSSDSSIGGRRPATPLLRRVPKKLVLGLLGALFVFDVLFYFLAVEPLGRREVEQQALQAALQRQIEAKTSDISQLQLVVGKVGQARSEGDKLLDDITLLRRTAFSTLLAELMEAASKAGIDTREGNFDIEPIEGTDEYGMIAVSTNFRGKYQNLVKLLNEIDRSNQFLIIESLAAAPRPESDDLQITMRINTFLRDL